MWGREDDSPLVLRASCREHGGSSFELSVGWSWEEPVLLWRLRSWPAALGAGRTSEWVEDGLRAARLDRIRGIGYIESCVGGILNFFQRDNFAAAVSKTDSFSRREGLRGCSFRNLGYSDT